MNDVICQLDGTDPDPRRTAATVFGTPRAASVLAGAVLLIAVWPISAQAAGSRAGVEAQPGEIVVMRAVPARPAARSMPPGQALLVTPSPESELASGLSHLEINSDSYGRVAAGGQHAPRGGLVGHAMSSFMSPLGTRTGGERSGLPKAATGGAMGAATGSIGAQVKDALSGVGLLGQGAARP